MNRLPLETKCLIAIYIRDEYMKSLAALSLVNQEWNGIFRPLLYEHIIICILKDDASHKFLWKPEASRVLVHVKRLSIIVPRYSSSGSPRVPYSGLRDRLKTEILGDRSIPKTIACSTDEIAGAVDLLMSNNGPVELYEAIR
ncbi:hypothetical protein N7488_012296 [Penicillium malachiteum]|nr:hypothetical protein N7488_012296 [Penicillium malachiteum]